MSNQEDKNCRGDRKPWYTIAEAAVRWCNIRGRQIQLDSDGIPLDDTINPCLRTRAEEILFAIDEGILPCGRDGRRVAPEDHVARSRRTVIHSDLKKWMIDNFPGEKPAFLFDDVEKNIHHGIDIHVYNELKARYEARDNQLKEAQCKINELRSKNEELESAKSCLERSLELKTKNNVELGRRHKNTLLIVIAALCSVAKINPSDRGISSIIVAETERLGARIGDDTIRSIMEETRTAIGARQN